MLNTVDRKQRELPQRLDCEVILNHVTDYWQDSFALISNPFRRLPHGSRGSRSLQLLN